MLGVLRSVTQPVDRDNKVYRTRPVTVPPEGSPRVDLL